MIVRKNQKPKRTRHHSVNNTPEGYISGRSRSKINHKVYEQDA